MVSPSHKRRVIDYVVSVGLCSVRRACKVLALSRNGFGYQAKDKSEHEQRLLKRMIELSLEFPRYGYRFITELLQREGWRVNRKKVQRLRRKEGLQVIQKAKKPRRRGAQGTTKRKSEGVNDVWCWDFIFDRTEDGKLIKILTLVDEYSRYCFHLAVEQTIRAVDVIRLIEQAVAIHGAPNFIRSDNGPEFIANEIRHWLLEREIQTMYIEPGCPWENPWVESFHSRFRDNCLNRELFLNLKEAEVVISDWKNLYNDERPHSGINYKSPVQVYRSDGGAHCRPPNPQAWANRIDKSRTLIPCLT